MGLPGPAPHQPVGFGGGAQHGVGDRADRGQLGLPLGQGGGIDRVVRHPGDRVLRRPCSCRGRRRSDGLGRGGRSAARPVRLQDVGLDVGVGLGAERARAGRRHSGLDIGEQRLGRLAAPVGAEGFALERRPELAVVQVGAVAGHAVVAIGGPAVGELGGGGRRGGARGEHALSLGVDGEGDRGERRPDHNRSGAPGRRSASHLMRPPRASCFEKARPGRRERRPGDTDQWR